MLKRPDVYLLILTGLLLWLVAAYVINWQVGLLYDDIDARFIEHDQLGAHPGMDARGTRLEARVDSLEQALERLKEGG